MLNRTHPSLPSSTEYRNWIQDGFFSDANENDNVMNAVLM